MKWKYSPYLVDYSSFLNLLYIFKLMKNSGNVLLVLCRKKSWGLCPLFFFFLSRYSKFCIHIVPSFFLLSAIAREEWSKINRKVYDVISWLNKNLKTLFDVLRRNVGLILKSDQLIQYHIREILMEKYA